MHPLTFFFFAAVLPTVWLMERKALDDYVKLRDCHYKYTLLEKTPVFEPPGMDLITINMTSQKWLDESEVDNPVWSHELLIIVPPVLNPVNSCLLIITSGEDNDSSLVDLLELQRPAVFLRTPVALLKPLPVQPLTFYNHPLGHKNITGLDIFAYSWWRFINDPVAPPYWLVQFPMVKATVRAMDTIRDYMKKNHHADITGFTLAGISMGGWIAWLTAAVDQRVNATVHVAMDLLNFTESFYHQYRAYCGWSYMLRPFYEMNITRELNNPRFSDLASHVDPLAYNERYTNVTKLIIVLSGDELFQPDNTRNYFSQLEGTKYLRVIPNHDYGIYNGFEVVDGIFYFYTYMANHSGLFPTVSWEIIMTNTSATIYLRTFNVSSVYSYHADSVDVTRRDFRMKIAAGSSTQNNPVKWIQTEMKEVQENVYMKEMLNPEEGWRGFFIQATYIGDIFYDHKFIVTSEMVVLPDTFPCSDCCGDGCHGTLV